MDKISSQNLSAENQTSAKEIKIAKDSDLPIKKSHKPFSNSGWLGRLEKLPAHLISIFLGVILFLLSIIITGQFPTLPLGVNYLISFILFLLPITIESFLRERIANIKYRPIKGYADKLLELFSTSNHPLSQYIELSVKSQINSLENLLEGDYIERTYAEQIAIADSLAKKALTRLWATSTDKPSKLWEEGVTYFLTLGKLNIDDQDMSSISAKEVPNKARLVTLSWRELFEDYSKNREYFESFVQWHGDNGFHLKFYLPKDKESLESIIGRSIVNDTKPLKDFMLRDGDLVYGRTEHIRGNRVELKYIPHEVGLNIDTFNSYETLFESLWSRANTVEDIFESFNRERDKESRYEQSFADYKDEFSDHLNGENFFNQVCERIKETKNRLIAVDIADRKGGAADWTFKEEYKRFLKASLEAAQKANVEAKRMYVVNNFLSTLTDIHLQKVLKTQLQAGFEIIIIEDKTIAASNVYADDFILVDDHFGFMLGDERFDKTILNVGKNLIPKEMLVYYKEVFDDLYKHTDKKSFVGAKDIDKLESFCKEVQGKS